MEQVFSDTENPLPNRENRKMSNFALIPNSCTSNAQWASQQASDVNQFARSKQNQMKNSSQVRQSYHGMSDQTYEQQQKCYQSENSKGLSCQDLEHLQQFNFHVDGSNTSISLLKVNISFIISGTDICWLYLLKLLSNYFYYRGLHLIFKEIHQSQRKDYLGLEAV